MTTIDDLVAQFVFVDYRVIRQRCKKIKSLVLNETSTAFFHLPIKVKWKQICASGQHEPPDSMIPTIDKTFNNLKPPSEDVPPNDSQRHSIIGAGRGLRPLVILRENPSAKAASPACSYLMILKKSNKTKSRCPPPPHSRPPSPPFT